MDKADLADGTAKYHVCTYFHGQLRTCYHQFLTYEACVPIWSKTVAQIGDDPASIPLFRNLDEHKTSTWELLRYTQETVVEQIQSLPPQERYEFTPAFIESAETVFGESDQSRWPTGMLLTRHLRQWDMERAVKHARTLPPLLPVAGQQQHARTFPPLLPIAGQQQHARTFPPLLPVAGQQQHTRTLPPLLPVVSQQQHARSLPPLLSVAGQQQHVPALPFPSGTESTIEGPPSKRQKIDRGEGESESALPSIVVSPPREHRAPLLPPLDHPMIPTSQLQQWKLEPDSKENEASRISGFSESTAQQMKIKTLDTIGKQTRIKTGLDEQMTEAPTTPRFDDLTAQQTEIKTEPDEEVTEAQTGSGRKDSLYPSQQETQNKTEPEMDRP